MAESDRPHADDPPLKHVEFDINDIHSEVGRDALREALKDLNGVRDVQFVGGGAIVTYNPIGITKEEICTAIRRSGYRATEIETRGQN
jgi:copper chaperone CopZ